MVKYVFLFPGQGAQAPGMAQDFAAVPEAKKVFGDISRVIGEDITDLLWNSSAETLARSDKSQLAITAASLAALKTLEARGIKPSAAAGFSLGEWPALYASGVLSFEDTLLAVKQRGEIMQKTCEHIAERSAGNAPGMAAVIGLEADKIAQLTAGRNDVFAVNMNSVKQTVVAGTDAGLAWCETALKDAGAKRVLRLKVAGPFHSPLMAEAAEEFAAVVEKLAFSAPRIALFSNVSGRRAENPEEIKQNCIKHIVSPVLWTDEEKAVADLSRSEGGSWKLLETGPGKVLSGLWKDTPYAETIPCFPCGTLESITLLMEESCF